MSTQEHAPQPEHSRAGLTPAEVRVLDRLRQRLEHHGVLPVEYGILEPKPDALVLERVRGGAWQIRYWDGNRGPGGRPRPFPHAVDAAKALLAELLWRTDLDDARARHRAGQGH
jgi:hypothetical protein